MTVASSPPHGLQVVIDFVNTLDLETGADTLGEPGELRHWLVEHGLAAPASPPGHLRPGHVQRARELRESLRAVMLAHNDGPDPAPVPMQQAAERGGLAVGFTSVGGPQLIARGEGVDGALARLLIPVAAAAADGSWARVKACRDDHCAWAFYDASRNRSARWCDMAVCGNRAKVRSYRARTR